MEKWDSKYRIPSARAEWWDYSNNGVYFITICTQNRTHFFGECINGVMALSDVGKIVQDFWCEIPKHFPFVRLGDFVIMPNHVHGVLIIDKFDQLKVEIGQCPISEYADINNNANEEKDSISMAKIGQCPISTVNDNTADKSPSKLRFRNQGKNTISSIIGSYKSICTKKINLAFPEIGFGWQKLFWDTIIKDEDAYKYIAPYIITNPQNWEKDKLYGNEL